MLVPHRKGSLKAGLAEVVAARGGQGQVQHARAEVAGEFPKGALVLAGLAPQLLGAGRLLALPSPCRPLAHGGCPGPAPRLLACIPAPGQPAVQPVTYRAEPGSVWVDTLAQVRALRRESTCERQLAASSSMPIWQTYSQEQVINRELRRRPQSTC